MAMSIRIMMRTNIKMDASISMMMGIRMVMRMSIRMEMGKSIWIMMIRFNIKMKTSTRMTMGTTSMRMVLKNLDNFLDGSLGVCKGDLALDAEKLNKSDRHKYYHQNYHDTNIK